MTTPADGCRLTGTMCECDSICEEDCRNDLRFTHGLEIEPAREEFSFTKPFKELAEEFRGLAAFAQEQLCYRLDDLSRASYETKVATWSQAAQMLEERLG